MTSVRIVTHPAQHHCQDCGRSFRFQTWHYCPVPVRSVRQLIDDARDAAARPGRYCDPMAYVILELHAGESDEFASCEGSGEYAERYGRRILVVDGQGFCSSERFRSEDDAVAAMGELHIEWAGDDDDDV